MLFPADSLRSRQLVLIGCMISSQPKQAHLREVFSFALCNFGKDGVVGRHGTGIVASLFALRFARDFDTIKWVAEGDLQQG